MGELVKLTGKGFLREHPFADPISEPANWKHSYIFPGDEIVLYHKISMPGDSRAATINDVQLISAKASLVVKKPQVFDEQFSIQFQSSRIFELDSFTTNFNNSNAPLIPWGSDGYAPYVNIQQNRPFRLPLNDFRRQINFFTQHTSSTSSWQYWFYFPTIFRWEYWIPLIGADNDFFNIAEPNNGLNQWWEHYFVSGTWQIESRLEISCLVDGVPNTLRSTLILTPGTNDVRDYNSNTDWINKSIKTSVIHGSPSNTPCLIKANEDTEVWGYFEKVSAWDTDEQGDISAVVWIEPFEGTGLPVRSRGSSLYPATNDTVFAGLNLSLTDDSDIGVQDDTGKYLIIDNSGNGAVALFDGTHPEKVTVFAIIDHNKLSTIYPGITQFTLYIRLYNKNTTGMPTGYTKMGEEIKQDCLLISMPDDNSLCGLREPMCPFSLDVFADAADPSEIKNDKSDFYYYGDALWASIVMTLQKRDSACGDTWTDAVTLSNSSYGSFFEFGQAPDFSGASFTDDFGKKYTGVLLDWRKVLKDTDLGTGKYRMKITKTDILGNITTLYDDREFCLHEYNCNLINRSVRIETLNQGLRGSMFDQTAQIDYGTGWTGQIRLKGVLKFKSSGYSKEYNQYGDTDFNAFRPVINEQAPKFLLSLRPVPGWMDWILSTNVLQADEVYITDYNNLNRHQLTRIPVMNDGDYAPVDNNLASPLASVDIALAYGQNNLRKRNSS